LGSIVFSIANPHNLTVSVSIHLLISMATIDSPSYITREALSEILLGDGASSIVIIDVRDEDHVGGHILGSKNVPSTTLDYRMTELVRTLQSKDKVVFHCALSQVRGPSAARHYVRERQRLLPKDPATGEVKKQGIYVLDGGFVKWQEK
jgi:rhodanese-related sulfurtransferase